MHKLIDYVCEELEEIERKVGKGQKLSMQELQYADTLAHLKKNLLKSEEMSGGDGYSGRGYSRRMSYDDGASSYRAADGVRNYVRPDGSYAEESSYARGRGPGAARDSMGRYSSDGSMDERTKQELMKMIERM
jgi:hypothetical protein